MLENIEAKTEKTKKKKNRKMLSDAGEDHKLQTDQWKLNEADQNLSKLLHIAPPSKLGKKAEAMSTTESDTTRCSPSA